MKENKLYRRYQEQRLVIVGTFVPGLVFDMSFFGLVRDCMPMSGVIFNSIPYFW